MLVIGDKGGFSGTYQLTTEYLTILLHVFMLHVAVMFLVLFVCFFAFNVILIV